MFPIRMRSQLFMTENMIFFSPYKYTVESSFVPASPFFCHSLEEDQGQGKCKAMTGLSWNPSNALSRKTDDDFILSFTRASLSGLIPHPLLFSQRYMRDHPLLASLYSVE